MNDRYLFRAKRKDNREWVVGSYVYTFAPDKKCHIVGVMTENHWIVGENGNMVLVDKYTICQCTGLKDKNGKLIWENDIVRYNDMIAGVEKIDRIEWNETHASFVILHRSKMVLQYLYVDEFIANECEVIGSAIDNPELLEV